MRSGLGLWCYTSALLMVAACLLGVMFVASCQKSKQEITEEVAYLRGLESWVYGYPIVLMDVTRQVLTAVPAPNAEGTPPGAFNITIRNYYPNEDALNGTYKNPPITRTP